MSKKKDNDTTNRDLDEFGLLERATAAPVVEVTPLALDGTYHGGSVEEFNIAPFATSESADDVLAAAREILGLDRSRASGSFTAAVAKHLGRQSSLNRVPLTKKRRWAMTVGPTPVPPNGNTLTQFVRPQVLFRGERLINTGDATGLFLSGLFVGTKPQFPAFSNPIPVKEFSANVLDSEMLIDICQPAESITFQVQNISAMTMTWSMTLFGHMVI